jgi:hypothetical protein
VIGPADVAAAFNVPAADAYGLNVNADADWTITIEFPRPSTAPAPPQQFAGRGQQVSGFLRLDGTARLYRLTHTGQGYFSVWLTDAQGQSRRPYVRRVARCLWPAPG